MTKKLMERHILIDEPSNEDLFHGKGHERTAEALAKAISIFREEDRAIGLDGPWGSGKSSVVGIAERKLSDTAFAGKIKFHFFTFDIWKSQGSSFRRSFLEHFLDWAKYTFPEEASKLDHIEKKVKGKVKEIHSNSYPILDWYGIAVLLFLPFLPLYYFWAKSSFDEADKVGDKSIFLSSWPFLLLLLFVLVTFTRALGKYLSKNDVARPKSWRKLFSGFQLSVSQTLLISAKQYEDQQVTQYIREIDPNDFEFQSTFREILSVVQSKNIRVVIVLDNIDRLPKDEIAPYWALVRAVFSRGPLSKHSGNKHPITAIVPYDRHHIEAKSQNENPTLATVDNSISPLSSREIFSKTFDEILTVSPPVMSNSRDFFLEKIRKALPEYFDADELFRVYLVFNRIIQRESGKATPRQIISFINELTGLYVLHVGRFRLPTIAVYIAYQDVLEANPSRLSERTLINDRIRALAADIELEQNLVAMIFNVEPRLAFQLLLDERIKIAATSGPNSTELASIAKSPGFDLRINEVLQNNIAEWQNSGEFGVVIENFAALAAEYDGDVGQHFANSLVAAFQLIKSIKLQEAEYSPYLKLFKLCDQSSYKRLTSHFIKCVLSSFTEQKEIEVQTGRDLVTFMDRVHDSLDAVGQHVILKDSLGSVQLPSNLNFIFGVAQSTPTSKIRFSYFSKPTTNFDENEGFLERIANEEPADAQKAFSEFNSVSLVKDEQWISVANSLLQSVIKKDLEDLQTFDDQLNLLSDIWVYTSPKKRSEIEIASAFEAGQFYQNIHDSFSEDVENPALANALFLAGQKYLDVGLPTLQGNDQDSNAHDWFANFFDGRVSLSTAQSENIAKQAIQASQVYHWLAQGDSKRDNQFILSVIRCAYSLDQLPRTGLSVVMQRYDYLKFALGRELVSMLSRFEDRITDKDLSTLNLEACPAGLLSDTFESDTNGWNMFHQKVGELLDNIPAQNWIEYLTKADKNAQLLLEKISTSGYVSTKPEFRDVVVGFVSDIFNGKIEPVTSSLDFDPMIQAIDSHYHADVFRKMRENLGNVSVISLQRSTLMFPRLIDRLLNAGDRIAKNEKDNVVRHLLCPALEGDNRIALAGFVNLGRSKVADFIKQSDDSTQQRIEGSWKHFSSNSADRDWSRQIGELLHGKRKARSFFDLIWGTTSPEEGAV